MSKSESTAVMFCCFEDVAKWHHRLKIKYDTRVRRITLYFAYKAISIYSEVPFKKTLMLSKKFFFSY